MPVAGPGREDQQQAGIRAGDDRMALTGVELEEAAGARRNRISGGGRHLDLAVDDDDPSALVHLVLLQRLPGGKVEDDRASVVCGGEDLRLMRYRLDRLQVPVPHRSLLYQSGCIWINRATPSLMHSSRPVGSPPARYPVFHAVPKLLHDRKVQ